MVPPIFDYDGSLEFAAAIYGYAGELDSSSRSRAWQRDASLDAWQGTYGDDHRLRAEIEDAVVANTIEAMERCGRDWAEAWRRAVDDMNEFAYGEAVREQAAYDNERAQHWLQSYYQWLADDTGTYYLPPQPAPGVVHKPVAAWAPVAPAFAASGSWFAHYERVGDDMVANYKTGPAY